MKFSPSATSRWMTCPASVRLSDGIVIPPSEYAVEGTGAHQLLETCQRLDIEPRVLLGETLETKDGPVVVTEEMVEAVGVFLAEIADMPVETSCIEQQLVSSTIEGLQGTADYLNFVGRELHVVDYKHGAGMPVAAEGNQQLLTYAGLAMETFAATFGQPEKVVLRIVQPRAESYGGEEQPKVKRWEVDPAQVNEHMEAVKAAVEIARREDAPLVPGDHCRWCPAKAQCPKLHQLAVQEAKADFRLPAPVELDDKKLLFWLDMGPILEDWLKGVRDHAKRRVEGGEPLPGWKLVESIGHRKWKGDEEDVGRKLVGHGFHPDDIYEPRTLKSPSQVEKVRPKGMKVKEAKVVVDEFTHRPVNGTSLVREGDRRPAIINNAANDFTRIE